MRAVSSDATSTARSSPRPRCSTRARVPCTWAGRVESASTTRHVQATMSPRWSSAIDSRACAPGTPERGVVLVLPGRDRRGAPTEVSVGASASTSALSTPTWLRRVSGCAADRRADASSRSGRAKPRAEPRHQAVPSRHGPGQWPRTDYVRFPQCGLVIEGQGSKLHGHQRLGVRPIASRWGLRSRSPGCDSNASARVRAAATSDGS